MKRLIIVSNRLPFTVRQDDDQLELTETTGGLVGTLAAYLARRRAEEPGFEALWVGWPGGTVAPEDEPRIRTLARERHGAVPVFLSAEESEQFHQGFCSNTLWPLFHYFPSYVEYRARDWDAYVRVNAIFRDAILEVMQPGDVVWIHDYPLMLLPEAIREVHPDAEIGFFSHVPFPAYELFRLLPGPWKRAILSGMLGADLIGFHTHDYTQCFLHSVFRTLGHGHHLGQVSVGDQVRRADTFPIGIDFDAFMQAASSEPVARRRAELEDGLRGRQAIFSVDRLDYTKGILNRLRGFQELLLRYPEWHEKVVLVLVVVPSRVEVQQYIRMKQTLDERVGRINGRFGSTDWSPILYHFRALDFESLSALYALAPVALITPLRDGMNVVAKEYLASKPDGTGVLILSEMAGAARELGEALLVNPNHRGELADALNQALTMTPEEQVRRNRPMQERLRAYDSRRWATHFLSSLSKVKVQQGELATKHLTPALQGDVSRAYARAERRVILLDYDGTLVPFAAQPRLAAPDGELLAILSRLMAEPRTHVYVLSGRDRETLARWFAPLGANIVAEHGAWLKEGDAPWRLLKPLAHVWKERLAPLMQTYADQVAGALFEEKEFVLSWHYRQCDPELGAQRAMELIDDLTRYTANLDVQVIEGKKVVEVRNSGVNKGAAALSVIADHRPGFILAVGDDQTDEDLFRALPADAVSVRVGHPFSHARYSLSDHREVRQLLARLVGPDGFGPSTAGPA